MRRIPFIATLLLPLAVLADYNPEQIKQGITEQANVFQVRSWKKSENGQAWIATTKLQGVTLSVGNKNAGMIAALQNSGQAFAAMLRCMTLGTIGTGAETEAERMKVSAAAQQATQSQSTRSVMLNKVRFEVEPQEVDGHVYLSCVLRPE